MNCAKCGCESPERAKFCLECGAAFAARCASCGTELPPAANFCLECGAQLQGLEARGWGLAGKEGAASSVVSPASPQRPAPSPLSSSPQPLAPSPLSYTPKHLADKILTSRSALEGERKQVTVLFADVRGSMELAEQLDPEAWHQILDRFFAILTEGVHRFEGTVNQYTGDGIMALFGAPIAHEDHAQRACYAALHLRDEIARYATEVKREHGVGFSTRMGINSGAVVVGRIGDDLRMDYTAQGHTVGLAQRMESIAEPNTCFLGEATAQLVRGYFALDDLGDFQIKGVTTRVRVYRLGDVGTAGTRFDVARARGFSRFVGRAADMRTLEDALDQAAAGNGQVLGVVAEAGTGKSRLCFEFLERCRARGLRVIQGRAVAHGRNIPFLPILEVFRAYYGITLEDDDRSAREKIAGRMMVLDQRLAPTLPLLYEFLGVGDPQNPAPQLDPEARQRQLIGVIRQVIKSAGTDGPTVTMVEDLHWLDDASAEFLEHMVDARAGSHSLLLLNFRPEYRAEWMQSSWYRQIPLTPLGVEAIGELLADLLGSDPSVAALAGPVHRRTGGNPFFTEEVAQSLIEAGHLEGTRGAYRLVNPVEKLEVPATVQAVLAARIDRLAEREKRLLQTASVIGKDFPEPLLAAVAELAMDELKSAIAALQRAEFVHEHSIYPVVEYAFKHPLTQELALGSQLRERRRQTHGAVARAIESQEVDHLDECAALLAHHWEEAGEALAAARWHKRAAEWVGRTDVAAAPRHWQRVRELRRALPDDREAAPLGIAACRYLLLALGFRAAVDLDQARGLLEEGQALAQAIGDQRESLYLSMIYSSVIRGDGDVATYLDLAIENRRRAFESDDLAAQINASTYLIDAFELSGRFTEALQIVEAEIARAPRKLSREEWAWGFNPHTLLRVFRVMILTWVGRLREALEEWGRVLRMSEEDGTPEMTGYVLCFTARAHYLAGDADRALACARQAEAISRGLVEHLGLTARVHLASAHAHLAGGRPVDAAESARSALDLLRRTDTARAGEAATTLGVALLEAGDSSAALSAAEEAIALCRRSLRAHHEAIAHGVVARGLLRRDGGAARAPAEAALGNAAALIQRTRATTLAPALCEWRAELGAVVGPSADTSARLSAEGFGPQAGDAVTRAQLLRRAQQGYQEIGAPGHAARLAKELEREDH